MQFQYLPSYYNHRFTHKGKCLLFNGATGALLSVTSRTGGALSRYLFGAEPFDIEAQENPMGPLLRELHARGFIIDTADDEIAFL